MSESIVEREEPRAVPRFEPGDKVRVLSFMGHVREGGTPYVPIWVHSPLDPDEYLHAYPGELAEVDSDDGGDCYVVETHRGTFCVVSADDLAPTESPYTYPDPGHSGEPLSPPRDEAGEVLDRLGGLVDFLREYPPGALAGEIWAIGYSQRRDWEFLHSLPDDASLQRCLPGMESLMRCREALAHRADLFCNSDDGRWFRGFVVGAMRIWNSAVKEQEIRYVLRALRADGVNLAREKVPA